MSEEVDLEKIAEFMNSEPEPNIDTNEIENTLDFIDTQLTEVKKQTKQITTVEEAVAQETTIDDLTKIALDQLSKIDKNTDEIYNLFYTPLALRQDRSDSSKIALLDSQRLKVEAVNSLAALANAKAKLEMAKAKALSGQDGIYLNAQSGSEVGISVHGLWEGLKEE